MIRPLRYLRLYQQSYPGIWRRLDALRDWKGGGIDWPNWCLLPNILVVQQLAVKGLDQDIQTYQDIQTDILVMNCLYAWRITKGIYHFDRDLSAALTKTKNNDMPSDILKKIPEWCIYLDFDGSGISGLESLKGAFVYLDHDYVNDVSQLMILSDSDGVDEEGKHYSTFTPFSIHMRGTVSEGLQESLNASLNYYDKINSFDRASRVKEINLENGFEVTVIYTVVSHLLYLCAANADFGRKRAPQKTIKRRGPKIITAPEPTSWNVGVRIGQTLRRQIDKTQREQAEYDASEKIVERSRPRPHIRRAHWHTYWQGPLSGEREPVIKWLAPTIIGASSDEADALPATVHPIKD